MDARLTVILTAVALVSAGCLGATDQGLDEENVDLPTGLLEPTRDQLWSNPASAPHPAFGFPTLTNPPTGTNASIPAWWQPIEPRDLPADITGLEHLAEHGTSIEAGAGIAVFGSLAIVPSWSDETAILDISTPQEPEVLSTLETVGRDVDTIAYPDGRLVAVFATDSGIVPVWDITDPTDPEHLVDLQPTDGSHNVAVVPGTPILYNANSAGGKSADAQLDPSMGEGVTEIYDLSDPEAPVHVQDLGNGYGCHDITFHISQEEGRYRAYCAGIEYTQIWDIEDPLDPEVLVSVPVHHGMADQPSATVPIVLFSHLAMVNADASVLIVGDETGGGAAPACDAYLDAGARTVSGPVGNLYFYDISDEKDPQLMGWMSPTHHYPTNPPGDGEGGFGAAGCTAHFGKLIPHESKDLMVMAWYGAGVTIIDFTDPSHPVIVDQWNENTNTWDVWYVQGYLFTGDLGRGLDVLGLV